MTNQPNHPGGLLQVIRAYVSEKDTNPLTYVGDNRDEAEGRYSNLSTSGTFSLVIIEECGPDEVLDMLLTNRIKSILSDSLEVYRRCQYVLLNTMVVDDSEELAFNGGILEGVERTLKHLGLLSSACGGLGE